MGVGYACVRAGGTWEISLILIQFCYETKISLKYKVHFKKPYAKEF